jgi:hypothetical protein
MNTIERFYIYKETKADIQVTTDTQYNQMQF